MLNPSLIPSVTSIDNVKMPIHAAEHFQTSVGIGLRAEHYEWIKQQKPNVPWFEVLIDNYLNRGGQIEQHLQTIRADYPFTFHSVGMSPGAVDPLDFDYLKHLKQAIAIYEPIFVSDHLCWTGFRQEYSHDLLPMPYTEEAAQHIANRLCIIQDYLGRHILIENVSSYLQYRDSEMSEAEFLCYVCELADCQLLLDVNNVYVSAYNHNFDAQEYIRKMPVKRIRECHLAGHEDHGEYLLDTHSEAVPEPVWELYKYTIAHCGPIPSLIEWDKNIPAFSQLQQQADIATMILQQEQVDAG